MARIEKRNDLVIVNSMQGRACAVCSRRVAETQRPQTAEQRQIAEMTALVRDLLDAKRRGLLVTSEADEWQALVAPDVSAQPKRRASVPATNVAADGWVLLQAPGV